MSPIVEVGERGTRDEPDPLSGGRRAAGIERLASQRFVEGPWARMELNQLLRAPDLCGQGHGGLDELGADEDASALDLVAPGREEGRPDFAHPRGCGGHVAQIDAERDRSEPVRVDASCSTALTNSAYHTSAARGMSPDAARRAPDTESLAFPLDLRHAPRHQPRIRQQFELREEGHDHLALEDLMAAPNRRAEGERARPRPGM